MAIQSSGAISLSDLQTEFGGSNPISLSEYYQNASPDLVTANNTNVPNTGNPIDLSDFYGAVKTFSYTFSSNAQEVDLNATLTTAGWNGSDPVSVTINSGIYIWSDDVTTAALSISSSLHNLLTITNNGYIIGRGGDAGTGSNSYDGQNGGPAISNLADGVTLTNASGAYIAGGGGGGSGVYGGGGAGGGAGGGLNGGTGGAVGASGSNGSYSGTNATSAYGRGGGSGGGAGGSAYNNDGPPNQSVVGDGGGGGRILPGTGGSGGSSSASDWNWTGGSGGSSGSTGGNGTVYFTNNGDSASPSGGGGGWGAAGGQGYGQFSAPSSPYTIGTPGSGGAAISGTAIATYTNNGTVYGSVA